MTRVFLVAVLIMMPLGCAKPSGSAEDAAADLKPAGDQTLPRDQSAASGVIELLFYDERAFAGQPAEPTLRLTTRVRVVEEGAMSFEQAEAVFTAPDGTRTFLYAGAGEYDQSAKRVALTGGVRLESGTLRIELQDMLWVNETQTARSEQPATIRDGKTHLQAETFEFYPGGDESMPGEELLVLSGVTGAIDLSAADKEENRAAGSGPAHLKSPAAGMGSDFTTMIIRAAPRVRMRSRRFESIQGGAAIELSTGEAGAEPVLLAADETLFLYGDGEGALPEAVELTGGVDLNGPPGTIRSDTARLDLRRNRFDFLGNVHGSTPEVEEFRADRLVYDSARIELSGQVRVVGADGSIKAETARRDESTRVMSFAGDVAMSSPEGSIRSNEAELNEALRTMTFTGAVRGDLGEVKGFAATRIIHHLDSGDSDITHLRIDRIDLADAGAPADAGAMDFSWMSIAKAPKVRVKARRVSTISGGLEFLLHSASPDTPPTRVRALEAGFVYKDDGNALPALMRLERDVMVESPQGEIRAATAEIRPALKQFEFQGNVEGRTPDVPRFTSRKLMYDPAAIVLSGDVDVSHSDGHIRADRAELDPVGKTMVFTGNVHGDAPPVRGLRAEQLVFNPVTNEVQLLKATIAEMDSSRTKPEDVYRLQETDILDWPGLVAALRVAEDSENPSPAKRIVALLPEHVRDALRRLPTDRAPNATVQNELLGKLNPLLDRTDLYDEESWRDAPLDGDTRALLARAPSGLAKVDLVRLNRGLLEAAFPGRIAHHSASEAAQP